MVKRIIIPRMVRALGTEGGHMSVNGITTNVYATDTYQAYASKNTKEKAETTTTENTSQAAESGVVYEPSKETTTTTKKTSKAADPALVAKLKADAEARTAQFRSLVEQLIMKQGNAYGQATDMWKFLASGKFTVDAQTKAQAQADIAEDGYWGVEQTSSRIYDFAFALAGDDEEKMEEMRAAFEKGFEQAKETWGGELPEISQKTYDAVMKKFDDYAASKKTTTVEEAEQ